MTNSEGPNTQNLTSHKLPVVSEKTINAVIQTYTISESWKEQLEKVKARTERYNPYLAGFIRLMVGQYPKEAQAVILKIVFGTIAMLEQQAQAHNIDNRTGLPASPDRYILPILSEDGASILIQTYELRDTSRAWNFKLGDARQRLIDENHALEGFIITQIRDQAEGEMSEYVVAIFDCTVGAMVALEQPASEDQLKLTFGL